MEFDPLKRTAPRWEGPKERGERAALAANLAFIGISINKEEKKNMSQYILWTPSSDLPPKVIIDSRPAAIKAAGRMAHENPGKTFYVCKLVNSACKPIPVEVAYEDLDR